MSELSCAWCGGYGHRAANCEHRAALMSKQRARVAEVMRRIKEAAGTDNYSVRLTNTDCKAIVRASEEGSR